LESQTFRIQADAELFAGCFARSWLEISELPYNEREINAVARRFSCLPAAFHKEHQYVFSLLGLKSMPKALNCSVGKDLPEILGNKETPVFPFKQGWWRRRGGDRQTRLEGPKVTQTALKPGN